MKRIALAALAAATLFLLLAGACASPAPAPAAPAQAAPADATSAASEGEEWTVSLSGLREETLTAAFHGKLLADSRVGVEKTVERKGVKYAMKGVPLRHILAIVDGKDAAPPYVFDEALWKAGYDVSLVAKDGYTATFSTKDISPDALILATYEDGKAVPPQIVLVGEGAKNLQVRDLVAIETSLAPNPAATAAEAFSLELEVNGTKAAFTLAELEKSDLWLEQKGSYTTSAGTRYSGTYGGARLRKLLERYAPITAEDSVSFIAMDGYEMTYPGSLVLDDKDGTWILAWKLDGEYLPKDPGYVRTVKVGPGDPNIDGHLSVRMVKRIVVKQKDFKDFSLSLEGKLSFTLDRSTVQSCVSCHKRTVTFERKGQVASYTGFPAWLALGYIDDPKYAPHRQDKSFAAYESALAKAGYAVDFVAADGFTISLDARDLDRNDDVILAMYKNDANLPADEFPLVLVWDKDSKRVPAGIKNARMLAAVKARF